MARVRHEILPHRIVSVAARQVFGREPLYGEPEATVTVQRYMNGKLDAGDSPREMMLRSKRIGVGALLGAVGQIERGTARSRPMDPAQATDLSFPRWEHARHLRRMGRSLLRGASDARRRRG